ncbi:MAG: type I glutamate--ammonia ligase [Mycoplasmatales bacterium]
MTKKQILKNAEENNITYVRLQFTDIMGIIKNVEIPVSMLNDALDGHTMFDGSSVEGFVRISETDMRLVPDLSTWMIQTWEGEKYGRVARLICNVHRPDGKPFEGDPRVILANSLKKLKEHGLDNFMIGFEPEFYAIKLDEITFEPLPLKENGGYFDLAPIDSGEDLRREIVMELQGLGFDIEASHHEVGPSQHEINFRFQNAIEACDSLQTFKLVVKNVASRHNMLATFMPKPFANLAGNGMHTNCSLSLPNGDNAFYDPKDRLQLSEIAYQWMAGIIYHSRAITAITNPTVNSYKRLVPGYEAPCYVAWSPSNRSTFIRIPVSRGKGTRIEIRSVDPTANPYLALAVILEAGLDGLAKKMKCIAPVQTDLFKLTREEREKLGIVNLPDNLYDAIKALKANQIICEALGKHTLDTFVRAKNKEWEEFKTQVHKWETDRYMRRY